MSCSFRIVSTDRIWPSQPTGGTKSGRNCFRVDPSTFPRVSHMYWRTRRANTTSNPHSTGSGLGFTPVSMIVAVAFAHECCSVFLILDAVVLAGHPSHNTTCGVELAIQVTGIQCSLQSVVFKMAQCHNRSPSFAAALISATNSWHSTGFR